MLTTRSSHPVNLTQICKCCVQVGQVLTTPSVDVSEQSSCLVETSQGTAQVHPSSVNKNLALTGAWLVYHEKVSWSLAVDFLSQCVGICLSLAVDFSLSVLESVYLRLWISLSVCWNLFISRCGFLSQCVGICLSLAVDFSLSVLESVYLSLSPSTLDFSLSVLESVHLWVSPSPLDFSLSVLESVHLWVSPSPLDFSLSVLESVYLSLSPSPLDFSLSVLESVHLWVSPSPLDFSLSVLESVHLWVSPSPLDFSLSVLESVYYLRSGFSKFTILKSF